RYKPEFITHWDAMLGNLSLASMVADKPRYDALLTAAAARGSPLFTLVEAVDRETHLTAEYENLTEEDAQALLAGDAPGDGNATAAVAGDVGQAVAARFRSRQQGV